MPAFMVKIFPALKQVHQKKVIQSLQNYVEFYFAQ